MTRRMKKLAGPSRSVAHQRTRNLRVNKENHRVMGRLFSDTVSHWHSHCKENPVQVHGDFKSFQRRTFSLYTVTTQVKNKGKAKVRKVHKIDAVPVPPGVDEVAAFKFARKDPLPPEEHTVSVTRDGIVSCTCQGFLNTGRCNHAGIVTGIYLEFVKPFLK